MAKVPDYARDPEGYLRALNEPRPQTDRAYEARDWTDRHWSSASRLRKAMYFTVAAGFLGGAAASVTAMHPTSGDVQPASVSQTCGVLTHAFPYEVPTSIKQELLSGDTATQAAGWAALEGAVAVPSGGSISEIVFMVDGDGPTMSADTARLNWLIAAEKANSGVLGTASPDSNAAASTATQLSVMSAEYCAPGQLS